MDVNEIIDIGLIKSGDEKAFQRIFNLYWKKVFHFVSIYIGDRFEQEDIVQMVFMRLWNNRKNLDEEKSLDGLLFIMTRNIVFNEYHKSFNEQAFKNTLEIEPKSSENAEDTVLTNEFQDQVNRLAHALPPRQRMTFLLSRRHGLSADEIAEKMSISKKGVERNLTAALKFIRKGLADYFENKQK